MSLPVLVLDDDEETLGLIGGALRRAGYEPFLVTEPAAARRALGERSFAAAVLDVMLGDESGLDLCTALRRDGIDVPVLFLSARGTVSARVDGLDAGGDDYLPKPFAVRELVARVRALTRRGSAIRHGVVRADAVLLDFDARRAFRAGVEVPITAREWDVLRVLADARGRVVSFDDILERAWGEASDGARASLTVIVTRLRRKLRPESGNGLLRTARGVGYCLVVDT